MLTRWAAILILAVSSGIAFADGPTLVGLSSPRITPNLGTTYPYSDDPIVTQITMIKRVHLLELRAAVETVRQQGGLPAVAWTDAQPNWLRAIHLTELRAAIEQAFAALRRPLPVWAESLAAGSVIKASHFQEIRNATRWQASGTITSNTTWTPSGSPYVVQGIVTVANGATLTIMPGTVVKFAQGMSLIVNAGATFVAEGTPTNPVVFTSLKDDIAAGDTNRDGNTTSPLAGDWNALEIGNGGRAFGSITNAVVRYGARLGVLNSTLRLENLTSTKMSGEGLFLKSPPGSYTVTNVRLLDNGINLQLIDVSSQTTIRDSAIRGATFAAVDARNGTAARLINNAIDENHGNYAILVDGSSPLYLRENSITRNRTSDGQARGISGSCCATVDARDNWWGSTTGPEIIGQSNSGGGGQVGNYVTYEPWLGNAWADGFKMGDHPWAVKAGVSVDVASGNFYLRESDVAIATVGFPLEIVRTYNSKNAGGTLTDFGVGWTWNYGTRLELNVDPYGVIWYRDDGTRVYFKRNFDGTFSGEDGIYERLVQEPGVYRLIRKDQSMLIFHPNYGWLGALQDKNQNTIYIARYSDGRVADVQDGTGRRVTFEYSGSRISRVTDPLGRTIEYAYHSNGAVRRVERRDQYGVTYGTTFYSYGPGGPWEMTAVDDADGNHLTMTYDLAQRVEEQKLNGNHDIDFAYGPTTYRGISVGEWQTVVFDSRGLAHLYHFNRANKVTDHWRQVMLGEGVYTWSHDEQWTYSGYLANSTREFDGTDGTTTATYDWNMGNLTRLVEPGGRRTTHTYDAFNNLTSTTDPRGNTTTYEYDSFHRLVKVTDPLQRSTRHEYGSKGLRVRTIDALNRTTTFTYDQWGYPRTIVNPAGETTSFAYDILGRKLSETTPQSGTTTFTYDARGNVLTSTDALFHTTSYSYDGYGRKTSVTDALNRTKRYEYSDLRNALRRTIDARNGIVEFTRDLVGGNITAVRDANNHTTTFVYDDLDRKIEESDPNGNSWRFTYIGRDRLNTVTDARGYQTTYFYDDKLQLVAIRYADNRTVSYLYDAAGNKTQMTDWTGTTQWVYDALNRVILVRRNGTDTSYGYDEVGNLSHLTVETGKPVSYTYDAANRLTSATDWQGRQTTYTHEQGRMASYLLPNAVTATFRYDLVGRPTAISYKRGATTIDTADYGYDAAGNRTYRRHTDGIFESYQYDELNRITSVYYPGNDREEYAYDASGNRTRKSTSFAGGQWSHRYFSYDAADQLLFNEGGNPCSYDSNGALLFCGPSVNAWDAQGRLSQTYTGSLGTSYVYDGDGRRLRSSRGSTYREYLVNTVASPHEVLRETNESGNATYYIYGHDLLYIIDQRGPHYHHTDALGSVISMTDASGVREAYNTFNVFGSDRGSGWNHGQPRRRFTGEEDDDNGLIYLRARYYEPYYGRFLSRDPFPMDETDTQSINRYVYVQNNPVNHVDPTGELLDTFADLAFIAYDLEDIRRTRAQGLKPSWTQYAALGIDIASVALPLVTGVGAALHATDVARIGPKVGSTGGPGAGKAFTRETKEAIRAQNELCVFCGVKTTRLPGPAQSNVDHAMPKARGGNNTISNAQNTCRSCNLKKGTMTTSEFRRWLRRFRR